MNIRTLSTIAFTVALPLFSSNAVTYSLDDGTDTGEIAVGTATAGYFVNAFQAQSGGTTVASLSIAFGGSTLPNEPFDIVLFTDPNNNGDPTDGVEAARTSVTSPGAISAGDFVSYSFTTPPSLSVGDWFYAGIFEDVPSDTTVALDAAGGTSSWYSFGAGFPGGPGAIGTLPALAFPNDLMIRAEGVPEPSTGLLAITGMVGLLLRRRRR